MTRPHYPILTRLRRHMIDDWRLGWRFWSVRLEAMGITCGAVLLGAPDSALQIWAAIPRDLRALMPPALVHWLPIGLGLLALAARFAKQGDLRK